MEASLSISFKERYWVQRLYSLCRDEVPARIFGDEFMERLRFIKNVGYNPNFKNPNTLNEKMSWLKLHDHREFCTMCVDKYKVRDYYRQNFGEDHIVPLVKVLDSWKEIDRSVFPDYPTIIKCNNGCGTWQIIRNPDEVNYEELRNSARCWMNINKYWSSQEWQYKDVKPCLIIEKLLMDNKGRVPADIKLHYFNGKCEFVYKVIDRETDPVRAFFTPDWELLPFQFTSRRKYKEITREINEPKPIHLDEMIKYGNEIAKNFKYVRVDFFDLDDQFYFSEITLYHGSGHNLFYPREYEKAYSEKLKLN